MVLMGPVCDIYDLAAITRANYRCNELGIDTISYGGTVACAMELAERGPHRPPTRRAAWTSRFGGAEALETPGPDDGPARRARRPRWPRAPIAWPPAAAGPSSP